MASPDAGNETASFMVERCDICKNVDKSKKNFKVCMKELAAGPKSKVITKLHGHNLTLA